MRKTEQLDKGFELCGAFIVLMFMTAPLMTAVNSISNNELMPLFPITMQFVLGGAAIALALGRLLWFLALPPQVPYQVGRGKNAITVTPVTKKQRAKNFVKENAAFLGFAGFLLLALVSTLLNNIPDETTILGFPFRREGIYTYSIYVFLFFTAASIKNQSYKKFLILTFAVVSGVIALLSVAAGAVNPGVPIPDRAFYGVYAERAVFGNSNHYGYYLAVAILVFAALIANGKWNINKLGRDLILHVVYVIGFALATFSLMYCDALGAFVAVAAGLVLLIVMKCITEKKFYFQALIPAVIFAAISLLFAQFAGSALVQQLTTQLPGDVTMIATNDPNAWMAGSWRWRLWTITGEQIKLRPLLGWGVEGYMPALKAATLDLQSGGIERTHNEYLQYAGFFGIPAALLYIAATVSVYVRGLKYRASLSYWEITALAGAFGYLVNAVFGISIFYTAPIFFVMLGLGVSRRDAN